MMHNPPERKPLIQNSVMKVRPRTEPPKCPLLTTFLMFRETAETDGLHSEELSIMSEPYSPKRTSKCLVEETYIIEGSQEIIYILIFISFKYTHICKSYIYIYMTHHPVGTIPVPLG